MAAPRAPAGLRATVLLLALSALLGVSEGYEGYTATVDGGAVPMDRRLNQIMYLVKVMEANGTAKGVSDCCRPHVRGPDGRPLDINGIADFGENAYHDSFALYAKRDYDTGDVLFTVSQNAFLRPTNGNKASNRVVRDVAQGMNTPDKKGVNKLHGIDYVGLLIALRKEEDSYFGPYVATLPQGCGSKFFDSLYGLDDTEFDGNVDGVYRESADSRRRPYNSYMRDTLDGLELFASENRTSLDRAMTDLGLIIYVHQSKLNEKFPHEFSFKDLAWAICTSRSRRFSFGMVPIVDLINAKQGLDPANVGYRLNGGSLEVFAANDISEGDELLMDYLEGDTPSLTFLKTYGFNTVPVQSVICPFSFVERYNVSEASRDRLVGALTTNNLGHMIEGKERQPFNGIGGACSMITVEDPVLPDHYMPAMWELARAVIEETDPECSGSTDCDAEARVRDLIETEARTYRDDACRDRNFWLRREANAEKKGIPFPSEVVRVMRNLLDGMCDIGSALMKQLLDSAEDQQKPFDVSA